MRANRRGGHIRRIQREYPDHYTAMAWLSPKAAEVAEQAREELIGDIFRQQGTPAKWAFAGTKLFTHDISPGCTLCGQGLWSCLFINGICNASCFYCPSEQKDKGLPITSSVTFGRAADYVDYVRAFKIKGVGFSGGEPLMSFDRVLDYLGAVRKGAPGVKHIWMYTNGLLATRDRFKALRDQGLDEIRFDLSANPYDLSGLEKAVGVIPVVTVEMPAIPEDLGTTQPLMRDLHSAGVNFLNLHQIRCTRFNVPKLIQRGYTFVHGPGGAAVLETEFAALRLIRYALDRNIPLPVNYCSFTFRHQFQKAGARHRNAVHMKQAWEDLTPTGYIRTMTLMGEPGRIGRVYGECQKSADPVQGLYLSEKGDQLSFSAGFWPLADFSGLTLKLTYSATALRPAASFRYPHREIRLNPDKRVAIERDNRHPGIRLAGDEIQAFARAFLGISGRGPGLPEKLEQEIRCFEAFSPGLAPYY